MTNVTSSRKATNSNQRKEKREQGAKLPSAKKALLKGSSATTNQADDKDGDGEP